MHKLKSMKQSIKPDEVVAMCDLYYSLQEMRDDELSLENKYRAIIFMDWNQHLIEYDYIFENVY